MNQPSKKDLYLAPTMKMKWNWMEAKLVIIERRKLVIIERRKLVIIERRKLVIIERRKLLERRTKQIEKRNNNRKVYN